VADSRLGPCALGKDPPVNTKEEVGWVIEPCACFGQQISTHISRRISALYSVAAGDVARFFGTWGQ
jgi:hypothetical protein